VCGGCVAATCGSPGVASAACGTSCASRTGAGVASIRGASAAAGGDPALDVDAVIVGAVRWVGIAKRPAGVDLAAAADVDERGGTIGVDFVAMRFPVARTAPFWGTADGVLVRAIVGEGAASSSDGAAPGVAATAGEAAPSER
jgi:hypothetical protein